MRKQVGPVSGPRPDGPRNGDPRNGDPRHGDHGPWRTRRSRPRTHRHPDPHPHLVAVRRADPGRYEVTLSPGADAADVAAAVGELPPGAVYTDHHPAPPGEPAATAVLVFQAPAAGWAVPGGVPAHPSPTDWPPPLLRRLHVDAGADRVGAVPAAAEHAVAAPLTTPATPTAHRRPVACAVSLTPTPTRRDPDTPPAAPGDAIPRAQQAA